MREERDRVNTVDGRDPSHSEMNCCGRSCDNELFPSVDCEGFGARQAEFTYWPALRGNKRRGKERNDHMRL